MTIILTVIQFCLFCCSLANSHRIEKKIDNLTPKKPGPSTQRVNDEFNCPPIVPGKPWHNEAQAVQVVQARHPHTSVKVTKI